MPRFADAYIEVWVRERVWVNEASHVAPWLTRAEHEAKHIHFSLLGRLDLPSAEGEEPPLFETYTCTVCGVRRRSFEAFQIHRAHCRAGIAEVAPPEEWVDDFEEAA